MELPSRDRAATATGGLLASIKLGRHRRYLLSEVWEAEKKMAAAGAVKPWEALKNWETRKRSRQDSAGKLDSN